MAQDADKQAFLDAYAEAEAKRAFMESYAAAAPVQEGAGLGLEGYSLKGAAKDVAGGALHAAGTYARMSGEIGEKIRGVSPLLDPVGAAFPGFRESLGQKLEQKAPDSGQAGFIPDVARATGSSLFFLAGAAGLGPAAPLGVAYLGAVSNGGQEYYTHLAERPDDEEGAWKAFGIGAGVGTTEAVPLGKILTRINKSTGGALRSAIVREMAVESLEEFVQEGGQTLASDIIAANLRDDEFELFESLAKAARSGAVGAVAVGPISGTATLAQSVLEAKRSEPVPDLADPAKFREQMEASGRSPDTPGQETAPDGAEKGDSGVVRGPSPDTGRTQTGQGPDIDATSAPHQGHIAGPLPAPEQAEGDEAGFAGPTAVPVSEEEIAAEGESLAEEDRAFVAQQRTAGYRGRIDRAEAPADARTGPLLDLAEKSGATVRWVQGERPLPFPGSYRQGQITLDASAGYEQHRDALLAHEFSHHMRSIFVDRGQNPEAWASLVQDLGAIGEGMLERMGQEYQARAGMDLGPDAFEDEAVAFMSEQLPNVLLETLRDPKGMAKLAQETPGLFRRFTQWLREIAAKLGLAQHPAVKALGQATELEKELGPQAAAKAGQAWMRAVEALSQVEPANSGSSVTSVSQPIAQTEAAPVVEAGDSKGEQFAAAPDYQGEHGAPQKDSGAPMHDLVSAGVYPEDVYSANGLRYYGTGEDRLDRQAYGKILWAKGRPSRTVTVYRAVPTDAPRGINPGDWVTISRQYAKDHGESALGGDYRIQSKRVRTNEIFTNGDSWLEWGYDPQPLDIEYERAKIERRKAKRETADKPPGPQPKGGGERFAVAPPDIRYAAAQSDITLPKTAGAWQRMIQRRQDVMQPFWRLAAMGVKAAKVAHGRATRYMDKAAHRHKKFTDERWAPLFAHVKKHWKGKDRSTYPEQYLYARHAEERNDELNRRRAEEKLPPMDAPSGMSTEDANAILAEAAKSPEAKAFEELAEMWDALAQAHLDMSVEYGLTSPEEAEHLREIFPHYVPLKTLDGEGGIRIGRGADIRGKEFQRAMGRESEAEAIFAHMAEAVYTTTVRGEKNLVAQEFLQWIRENREALKGFVRFREPRRWKKDEVQDFEASPDTIIGIKEGGVEYRIEFADDYADFAKALRVLTAEQLEGTARHIAKVTRFVAAMSTRWNPVFPVFNAIRDAGTAFFTSSEHGLAFSFKVMADIPAAFQALFLNKGPMVEALERFREDGVQMAFMGLDETHELAQKIANDLSGVADLSKSDSKLRAALKGAKDLQVRWADAVENMARLSTYKNAREMLGLSRDEAADYAKDITTNFRRKGLRGSHMNAWYMFSNAGLQGTERITRALKDSPSVRKVVLGATAMSAMMSLLARFTSDDDEDGVSYYEAIPEYVRRNNIIIPVDGKRFLMIPAPFVFNWFHSLGNQIADMTWEMATGQDVTGLGEVVGNMATATVDSFNPLGGTDQLPALIAPTVVDPIVDIYTNKDFAGRSIAREPFPGQETPRSRQYWPDVNPTTRKITTWLNDNTGGDEFEGGVVDVNPEHLQHLLKFATGGLGAQFGRAFDIGDKVLEGEEVPTSTIPGIRRIIKDPSPFALGSRFKEASKKVETEWKRKKAGSTHDEALARLRPRVQTAERKVKKLKERLARAPEQAAQIERQIREIQAAINRQVFKTE